jgi:hypothetical protein
MSQPVTLGDCTFGASMEGFGLLTELMMEVSEFKYKPVMPIKTRKVAGVKHDKLDQMYEHCEVSFKVSVTGPQALDMMQAKINAWNQNLRQPTASAFAQQRYRDASGGKRTVRFFALFLEPGETSVGGDGYMTMDMSGKAEKFSVGL